MPALFSTGQGIGLAYLVSLPFISDLDQITINGSVALSSTIWCRLYQKSYEKFSWYGELENTRVTSYFC